MKNCIYTEIAKNSILKKEKITKAALEVLVRNSTLDQLDKKVNAKTSLLTAIHFISAFLDLTKAEKITLKNYVFGDIDNDTVTKNLSSIRLKTEKYSNFDLAFFALTGVHDIWVMNNAKNFESPERKTKKYQHLPIEMIGWEEVILDFKYVKPILELLVIDINEKQFHEFYDTKVYDFFKRNKFINSKGEIDRQKICESLLKGIDFYPALSPVNTAKSYEEAEIIINQSMDKIKKIFK